MNLFAYFLFFPFLSFSSLSLTSHGDAEGLWNAVTHSWLWYLVQLGWQSRLRHFNIIPSCVKPLLAREPCTLHDRLEHRENAALSSHITDIRGYRVATSLRYSIAVGKHTTKLKSRSHNHFCRHGTRWFKYDRDWLCVNKSQFVPVIFEPPCTSLPLRGQKVENKITFGKEYQLFRNTAINRDNTWVQ